MKNLKKQRPKRECVYRRIFPSRSIDFYQYKILPSKAPVKMTQTDVLSPRTFCPHGRFVHRTFCPTDVLSDGPFVPMDDLSDGRFVTTDVLSPRMFCPHGCFVPTDVLSPRRFCRRTFCLGTNFHVRSSHFPGLGRAQS
jgi:hypothetical protein